MGFVDVYLKEKKMNLQFYTAIYRNIELTLVIMPISNGLPKDSGHKTFSEIEFYQKIAFFIPQSYIFYLSFIRLQPDQL